MKKVFFALAAIAMVAVFASCEKTCDCTLYSGSDEGEVYEDLKLKDIQSTFPTFVKNEIKKCSDVSEVTDDADLGKWGVECK